MSKIDQIANHFADAVREAFIQVYGPPARKEYLESVRPSWSDDGVAQGWHDPDPGVVIVGTEYGWIQDPWSSVRDEHKNWEKAMRVLKHNGWDQVNFESINAGVHIVFWMPPRAWQDILNKRQREKMGW
jgi:hypothetical protein